MLEIDPHASLYEVDLLPVWPRSDKDRERKIREFAKRNGWKVQIVDLGMCAIFSKDGAKPAEKP
jgi:hypothetical protein